MIVAMLTSFGHLRESPWTQKKLVVEDFGGGGAC